jgi:hypothetical protein
MGGEMEAERAKKWLVGVTPVECLLELGLKCRVLWHSIQRSLQNASVSWDHFLSKEDSGGFPNEGIRNPKSLSGF